MTITAKQVKHILVVDDEAGFADFLGSLLTSRGYRVNIARNGAEALARVQKETPDLVLLDMRMPKMGGIEFFTKVCGPYGRPKFPVIVLTALTQLSDFFSEALVDEFLTKPVEAKDLLAKVDALLSGAGNLKVAIVDKPCAPAEVLQGLLTSERFQVQRFNTLSELAGASHESKPSFVMIESKQAIEAGTDCVETLREQMESKGTAILIFSHMKDDAVKKQASEIKPDGYVDSVQDAHQVFRALRYARKARYS